MRRVLISIVLLSVLAFVSTSSAAVIADSEDDFGSTQGYKGWTYEISHGAGFWDLGWDAGTSTWFEHGFYAGADEYTIYVNGTSLQKFREGGPVNGGVKTKRTWTADASYTSVSLEVDYELLQGRALAYHYDVLTATETFLKQFGPVDEVDAHQSGNVDVATPDMDAGDYIYLYLEPWSSYAGRDHDMEYQLFDMQITGVPEPAAGALR
jgi:hypothetical protein